MGIDLLTNSDNMNEEIDTVHMMSEASHFMSDTLNSVLTMEKMEQGKLQLVMEPFRIVERLVAMIRTFKGTAKANHITINKEIRMNSEMVLIGDCFQLDHVTANFLSNAIKFSKPHTTITVSIEERELTKRREGWKSVRVTVKDEGPGIAKEDISKMFTAFTQIRAGELQHGRGTGIGLSICKQIVKLHGGEVQCESELGVGSVFSYTIPFEEASLEEPSGCVRDGDVNRMETHSESGVDSISGASHVYEEKKADVMVNVPQDYFGIGDVLVVDDVLSNRKMLSLLLGKRKVLTEMAEDGADVLAMAKDGRLGRFNLIFMDNQMPNMSGIETVRQLRALGFRFLVIGLTASALSDDVEAYVEAGADIVLSKPLQMDQLESILKFVAENGSISREASRLVKFPSGLEW
eukprot:gene2492-2999_t